jgi:hypothetical protein
LIFDFWCFNATFNNISAISWRPALVVEEAGIPGENHRRFEKGVHGEKKNAGVRTPKKGGTFRKKPCPPHPRPHHLQVKWSDTTEGGAFYNGTRRRMFLGM